MPSLLIDTILELVQGQNFDTGWQILLLARYETVPLCTKRATSRQHLHSHIKHRAPVHLTEAVRAPVTGCSYLGNKTN